MALSLIFEEIFNPTNIIIFSNGDDITIIWGWSLLNNENYLPFQINVVSPIADNAFNYYKYKFEGSFFTENNQQINKIKVTPRRESEPVVEGYIYIVDDTYAIYASDLSIKGN